MTWPELWHLRCKGGSHSQSLTEVDSEVKASTSSLRLFKNRMYAIYWSAGFSVNLGWQIQIVAISWLMASLGGTPELVALVQTAIALPVMLLSLPGGAISDLIGQRIMSLWAQSFLFAISVILALLAFFDGLTPYILLACTLLLGSGRALYYPGWQAMVFQLLDKKDVPNAIALNSSNVNIARSVGPAIGGAIVALAGAFFAFVLSAFSNLIVFFAAKGMPKHKPDNDLPPESLSTAIMSGLRYVALSPSLLIIMLRSAVFNISAIAILALLPLVAKDLLGGGVTAFGILLAAFGVGAVIGSLYITKVRAKLSLEAFLALGFVGYALAGIVLAESHFLILSAIGALLGGIGWTFIQVTFYSIVQISSPRWVLSRSIAIYQMAVFGGNAVGSLVWGALAGLVGTQLGLIGASVFLLFGALLGYVFKIREQQGEKLDSLNKWRAPTPQLAIHLRSGPIITTIQYQIDEADAPIFVSSMNNKRRDRLRDGASGWTLTRDIQDPNIWFERFKVPTWADAQRLHARRTVAGEELIEFIRSLHRGEGLPEVQYELEQPTTARQEQVVICPKET